MATVAVLLLSVMILSSGILSSPAEAETRTDDKVSQTARAADLSGAGWKLWQSQKPAEAEAKFSKSVKLDPKSANAWNGLGWARFSQGKYDKSVEAFEKCVAISPEHPAALNGLGQASFVSRDYDKAEKYFLQAKGASAAWYGLMKLYVLQGKFKEANKWLTKLRKDRQANQQELDQFAKVISDEKLDTQFRQMIEPPKHVSKSGNSAELAQRGWQLFFKGQNRPAEVAFREALKADPKNDAASNGLGFALLNQGNTKDAQPLFESLLEKNPNHGGAQNGLARCYKANGKIDDAIKLWKKMDKQASTVTAATSGLAMTYYEQEKYDDALPYLRRLAKADPKNAEFKKMLAKAKDAFR